MIPSRGEHVAPQYQRGLAEVQTYIQARLETDEPYLLSVNPAQVAEYDDELQHYMKQKQQQLQLRRRLAINTSQGTTGEAAPQYRPEGWPPQSSYIASDRALRPPLCGPQGIPMRLPGVEWLLAKTSKPLPIAPVPPPTPYALAFQHRMLKKQKTM